MFINLISDTVTKPSPPMLEAMFNAEVGDDVFGDDPTVNALEKLGAEKFGMEASLFCPSGTMTNQLAIKTHTQPLDEIICDVKSHIYKSEVGVYSVLSGVSMELLHGENGIITETMIAAAIKPHFDWLPRTRLVVLENTINHAGGNFYTLKQVKPIAELCKTQGLALHLDGARLFNALAETDEQPKEWGKNFDSISICLSKGLGAPVGSLLLGKKEFIARARRFRKAFGGGMRQAGYLAAAGIYALNNNTERLKEDNRRAKQIGNILEKLSFVTNIRPVKTNIVIFDVVTPFTGNSFLEKLKENKINAALFGPNTVRFVTHLHITDDMIDGLEKTLTGF